MVQDNSLPPQPVRKTVNLPLILAVIGLIAILGMAMGIKTCNNYTSLRASVQFDVDRFNFRNDDDFPWTDAQFLLNADYKFNLQSVSPNSEFTVSCDQFAKDDGTKFNPSYNSPTDLIITAKVPNNQWSSWFYRFVQPSFNWDKNSGNPISYLALTRSPSAEDRLQMDDRIVP